MRSVLIAAAVVGLLFSSHGLAQDGNKGKPATLSGPAANTSADNASTTASEVTYALPPSESSQIPHLSTGVISPTPEMWFYQEELRQYLDSRLAVRRNAEIRAAQRRERLASLKWYGMSNSRPVCSSDPFNGDYSPHWSSGSPNYPNRWSITPRPWVVLGGTQVWYR